MLKRLGNCELSIANSNGSRSSGCLFFYFRLRQTANVLFSKTVGDSICPNGRLSILLICTQNVLFLRHLNSTDPNRREKMQKSSDNWLNWAKEIQSIAQNGLTYTKDVFDKERFERLREISAEIMSCHSRLPIQTVKNLFCNEVGFQTPKLDTRAVIFEDDKILLVKENDGKWALPGGWVDFDQTIKTNTEKEVKEEAGLDVKAIKILAVHDRNRHNQPPYAYNVCKFFILCEVIGGRFKKNTETVESRFFSLEELPCLAEEKNTKEQIEMCFKAGNNPHWLPEFD